MNLQQQFEAVYQLLGEHTQHIKQHEVVFQRQLKEWAIHYESWERNIQATLVLALNMNKMTTEGQAYKVNAWCLQSDLPNIKLFMQNNVISQYF